MTHNEMTPSENKSRPRQARELARRLGLLTEAQAAAGWGVILVLAALLGVIYLNQASSIATIGRRVQEEQLELDDVKLDNADLERRIAEAQSLERLTSEAVRMGFVPATAEDIDYVVIPDYPVQPAPPLPIGSPDEPAAATSTSPETIQEALLLALRASSEQLTTGETGER